MLEEAEVAIKTLEYLEEVLPLVEQVVAVVLQVLVELRHKQGLQTLVVVVGLLLTLEQMVVQEL
jgi:hypothetical protein